MNDIPQNQEPEIEEHLECSVCQDVLFKPVTIACGHSFCKECCGKSLKINPQCPLCRTPCFVQENGLKENVTLKSIVETKYPEQTKRRQNKQSIQEEVKSNSNDARQQEIAFNPLLVLPLHDVPKRQIFPNTINEILVRVQFDLKYIWQVCPERKCLVISDNAQQEGLPHITCIFEVLDMKPTNTSFVYKVQVKTLQRVTVENINFIELTSQMEGFAELGEEKITLKVGHGKFLRDEMTNLTLVQEKIRDLTEILNHKLQMMFEVSNSIGQMVAHNVAPLLNKAAIGTLDHYTDFSFGLAYLIKANKNEKQAMFEETNLLKRLILLKGIADRFENQEDPVLMFEFEIPGSKAFSSLGASLVVLALIIIGLLLHKVLRIY